MRTPNLNDAATRRMLPCRRAAYWNILEYCRHLGLEKRRDKPAYWVARIRTKSGTYRQSRLGPACEASGDGFSYENAVAAAEAWFASTEINSISADPYPVGTCQTLRYVKTTRAFTVGDSLVDYVEWKRIAATKKTFDVLLSLINHHIMPSLGDVPLEELTSTRITKFYREVLETPPKRGNRKQGPRRALPDIDADALRRRKATANTLAGILRLAVQMAWENGHINDERSWRCIKRLPNQERPRQLFLTRAQCRELIQAARPDLADLIRAALYTGCRIAELSELRCRDVGRDIFGIFIASSKSCRSRYIYLPEQGMRFFLSQTEGREEEARVFQTRTGTSWDGRHKHLFRKAVRGAGLPETFVFHGLRHTYASQLVQAGAPLAMVARQLGHANTDTVSRTYGHLSCASIESELQTRFASFEPQASHSTQCLEKLRRSLQADEPASAVVSWPRSNFGKLQSPIIAQLKGR